MATLDLEELNRFIAQWRDSPAWLGGWLHNYYCDDDGTKLIFDLAKPLDHECPKCHRHFQDARHNNAWVYIARRQTIDHLRLAALAFQQGGDALYLAFIRRVFRFYTDNYQGFAPHVTDDLVSMEPYITLRAKTRDLAQPAVFSGWQSAQGDIKVVGPGKLMGQGLDDAVAMLDLGFVYTLIKDRLSKAEQQTIKTKLFIPARTFLDQQQFVVHNISFWREAAIQALGILADQPQTVDLSRPLGIADHLKTGVTADGWWFEGSFGYHFYVVQALAELAYFLHTAQIDAPIVQQYLLKMLTFPCQAAFANGELPNPNDSGANASLTQYYSEYQLACAAFPDEPKFNQLRTFVAGFLPTEDASTIDSHELVNRLAYSQLFDFQPAAELPAIPKLSGLYPASKIAILHQGDWQLFVKYGINTYSHAHADPLTFEAAIGRVHFMRDLSNTGYSSRLNPEWYNTTLGHQAIVMNGKMDHNHAYHAKTSLNNQTLTVSSQDIFELGETISRTFKLEDHGLTVETHASGQANDAFIVPTHFDLPDANFTLHDAWEPASYMALSELHLNSLFVRRLRRCAQLQNAVQLIALIGGETYQVSLSADAPVQFYLLNTIGNPADRQRTTLLAQAKGHIQLKLKIYPHSR